LNLLIIFIILKLDILLSTNIDLPTDDKKVPKGEMF